MVGVVEIETRYDPVPVVLEPRETVNSTTGEANLILMPFLP